MMAANAVCEKPLPEWNADSSPGTTAPRRNSPSKARDSKRHLPVNAGIGQSRAELTGDGNLRCRADFRVATGRTAYDGLFTSRGSSEDCSQRILFQNSVEQSVQLRVGDLLLWRNRRLFRFLNADGKFRPTYDDPGQAGFAATALWISP